MGVLSRGRLLLTPFGALSQALAQEILARAGQEEGVYPYVPLDLLEEGEEAPQPRFNPVQPAAIQVELKLVLEALRGAEKTEKERIETVQRILVRTVRLQTQPPVPPRAAGIQSRTASQTAPAAPASTSPPASAARPNSIPAAIQSAPVVGSAAPTPSVQSAPAASAASVPPAQPASAVSPALAPSAQPASAASAASVSPAQPASAVSPAPASASQPVPAARSARKSGKKGAANAPRDTRPAARRTETPAPAAQPGAAPGLSAQQERAGTSVTVQRSGDIQQTEYQNFYQNFYQTIHQHIRFSAALPGVQAAGLTERDEGLPAPGEGGGEAVPAEGHSASALPPEHLSGGALAEAILSAVPPAEMEQRLSRPGAMARRTEAFSRRLRLLSEEGFSLPAPAQAGGVSEKDVLTRPDGVSQENVLPQADGVFEGNTLPQTGGAPERNTLPQPNGASERNILPQTGGVPERTALPQTGGVFEGNTLPQTGSVPEREAAASWFGAEFPAGETVFLSEGTEDGAEQTGPRQTIQDGSVRGVSAPSAPVDGPGAVQLLPRQTAEGAPPLRQGEAIPSPAAGDEFSLAAQMAAQAAILPGEELVFHAEPESAGAVSPAEKTGTDTKTSPSAARPVSSDLKTSVPPPEVAESQTKRPVRSTPEAAELQTKSPAHAAAEAAEPRAEDPVPPPEAAAGALPTPETAAEGAERPGDVPAAEGLPSIRPESAIPARDELSPAERMAAQAAALSGEDLILYAGSEGGGSAPAAATSPTAETLIRGGQKAAFAEARPVPAAERASQTPGTTERNPRETSPSAGTAKRGPEGASPSVETAKHGTKSDLPTAKAAERSTTKGTPPASDAASSPMPETDGMPPVPRTETVESRAGSPAPVSPSAVERAARADGEPAAERSPLARPESALPARDELSPAERMAAQAAALSGEELIHYAGPETAGIPSAGAVSGTERSPSGAEKAAGSAGKSPADTDNNRIAPAVQKPSPKGKRSDQAAKNAPSPVLRDIRTAAQTASAAAAAGRTQGRGRGVDLSPRRESPAADAAPARGIPPLTGERAPLPLRAGTVSRAAAQAESSGAGTPAEAFSPPEIFSSPADARRAVGPEPVELTYGQAAASLTPPPPEPAAAGADDPRQAGAAVQAPAWAQAFSQAAAGDLLSGGADAAAGIAAARNISSQAAWAAQAGPILGGQGETGFTAGQTGSEQSASPFFPAVPAGQGMVNWTAPGWQPPTAPTQLKEPAGRGQTAQEQPQALRISDAEIRRTADQVYRIIEDRLRRERRRLGL